MKKQTDNVTIEKIKRYKYNTLFKNLLIEEQNKIYTKYYDSKYHALMYFGYNKQIVYGALQNVQVGRILFALDNRTLDLILNRYCDIMADNDLNKTYDELIIKNHAVFNDYKITAHYNKTFGENLVIVDQKMMVVKSIPFRKDDLARFLIGFDFEDKE